LLEPGETVVSKEHSSALASIFRAAGVPGYQQGGLAGARGSLSDIQRASHQSGGWLGSLFSGIGDAGKIMLALMTGNSTAAVNAFSSLFHTPAAGELATMMLGIPRTIVSDAVHSVIHLFSSLGGVITGGRAGAIGGGVQRYAGTVAQVLRMLGQPAGDIGVVLSQMTTESGGNPLVVNKWDSNWAAGTPSVGLMQVIGPTFRAYAGPFAGLGPFEYGVSVNPLANIFAGINYAIHRYGAGWTSVLGHGHGYDQGGWLYPGEIALSKLTKPEAILSPSQWEAIYSAAQRGGDGDQYHMHFDGMSYKAFSAEVGHAMRVVDVHKGLSQRSGRRV
jgi:hypothetical protein